MNLLRHLVVCAASLLFVVNLVAAPPNDLFQNRIALSGSNVTVLGSLAGATLESGEPNHSIVGANRSIWWSWTAPANGTVILSAGQSDFFGSGIGVYTGSSVSALTRHTNAPGDSVTRLPVNGGTTYQIAVADRGTGDANVVLTLQWFPRPPNDDFANRATIVSAPASAFGWTLGATTEAAEQVAWYGRSVWWQWTAPVAAPATVSIAPAHSQARLVVFPSNTLANLYATIAIDDDGVARFNATAGANYILGVFSEPAQAGPFQLDVDLSTFGFISPGSNGSVYAPAPMDIQLRVTQYDGPVARIDLLANGTPIGSLHEPPWNFTWSNPPEGDYQLTARLVKANGRTVSITRPVSVRPSNDLFANRILIPDADFVVSGIHTYASVEPGEPIRRYPWERSLWWSWRAPSNGVLEVTLPDTAAIVDVTFYTGENVVQLTEVARMTQFFLPLYVPVIAGQTYQIAAPTYATWTSNLVVAGKFYVAPSNDHFANRQVIGGNAFSSTNSNVAATVEPGEPTHANTSVGSLWWSWRAPSAGQLRLRAYGATDEPACAIAVYSGDALSNLIRLNQRITSEYQWLTVDNINAGSTYQIAVDTRPRQEIRFDLEFIPAPANDVFANATVLEGLPVTVPVNNTGASIDPGDDGWHADVPTHKTLWWRWTAPRTVRVSVSTTCCFPVAVYQGTSRDNLIAVNGDRLNYNGFAFQAQAGSTYVIAAGSSPYQEEGGEFLLRISDCSNDNFADRLALTGTRVVVSNANFAATFEPGEPFIGPYPPVRTMWWTWRAPFSGTVGITHPNADFYAAMSVFTGSNLSSLRLVTNVFQIWPPLLFQVIEGTDYHIAIGSRSGPGYGEQAGNFLFTLELTNTLHLSSPAPGFQGLVPRDVTITVGPILPEIDGVVNEIHLFHRESPVSYFGEWLGSVTPDSPSLTRHFDVPGTYRLFALATNTEGRVLQSANVPISLRYPTPLNDNFADRIHVTGSSVVVTGLLAESTLEPGEPDTSYVVGSVWWSWTAPSSGRYAILEETGYGYDASVYAGSSLETLVWLEDTFDAQAGTEYQVRLGLYDDSFGSSIARGGFRIMPAVGPPNDHFTNRIALTGTNVVFSGSTLLATREPQDPVIFGDQTSVTVWWKWTAPSRGIMRVWIEGGFQGQVFVLMGSSLGGLVPMSEYGVAEVTAGVEYQILLTGWYPFNVEEAELHLELTSTPSPPNDDFANRIRVSGASVLLEGTTLNATREPNEPARSDYLPLLGSTVWWSWTAPVTGYAFLTTTGSVTKPFIDVFHGASLNTITSLFQTTTYFQVPDSFVFFAQAGETYHIQVYAAGDEFYDYEDPPRLRPGPVTIELVAPAPPANDLFANAVALSGNQVFGTGGLLNATVEPGEPEHASFPTTGSVWYSWTAPATGKGSFRTFSGAAIAVYRGSNVNALVGVGGKDVYDDYPVEFIAVPNETYRIAVASHIALLNFPYQFYFHPSPANDFFANRLLLEGDDIQVSASFLGATPEPPLGPPVATSYNGDLWWTWRAPGAGVAELSWVRSEYTPIWFGVYSGTNIANLNWITEEYHSVPFAVSPGRWYQIRVAAWSGETDMAFRLRFFGGPEPSLRPAAYSPGAFGFELQGTPGETFQLETSTDLIDWSSLGLHTFYGPTYPFTDVNAVEPMRFYRAAPVR